MKWTGIDPLSLQGYRIQTGTHLVSLGTQSFLPGLSQLNKGNCSLLTSFVDEILLAKKKNQLPWGTKPIRRQLVTVDLQKPSSSESGMSLFLSNEFCINKLIYGRILKALYHLYSAEFFWFFAFLARFERWKEEKRNLFYCYIDHQSWQNSFCLVKKTNCPTNQLTSQPTKTNKQKAPSDWLETLNLENWKS